MEIFWDGVAGAVEQGAGRQLPQPDRDPHEEDEAPERQLCAA